MKYFKNGVKERKVMISPERLAIQLISVLEKNTGKVLARTGITSLSALPQLLEMPLKEWV